MNYILKINEKTVEFYFNTKKVKTIDIGENPKKHFEQLNIKEIKVLHDIPSQQYSFIKKTPGGLNLIERNSWFNNQYQFFKSQYKLYSYQKLHDNEFIFHTINYEKQQENWINYALNNCNVTKVYSSIHIISDLLSAFYVDSKKWNLYDIKLKDKHIHIFNKNNIMTVFRVIEGESVTLEDIDYIMESSVEETFKYIAQEVGFSDQDVMENTKIYDINSDKAREIASYLYLNIESLDDLVIYYANKNSSLNFYYKDFYINKFLLKAPKTLNTVMIALICIMSFNIYLNQSEIKKIKKSISLLVKPDIAGIPLKKLDHSIKIENSLNKSGIKYQDLKKIKSILNNIIPQKVIIESLKIAKVKNIIEVVFDIKNSYNESLINKIQYNLDKKGVNYEYLSITQNQDKYNITMRLSDEK